MSHSKSMNSQGLCRALLAIKQGQCSATDIINAYFDRIDAREDKVGTWQYRLSREDFLQHYRQHQAFYEQSLLKGLPVGVKDIIDTEDMPTEMGSIIHRGRRPVDDASCVSLLRDAGAIVLGKTVTTEFAYFKPGKTANPRDLQRTPGGSSSGSAAAVADGMVPVALGSQTAASVIRPAAYCGAVGYVGSRGEFSLRGIQPLAQSLDSLGLFSRRVEDIALMRSILLRREAVPPACEPTAPRQVLVCAGEQIGECEPEMQRAVERITERLQQQGVETVLLEDGMFLRTLVEHHQLIMAYEVARNLVKESQHPESLSEQLNELISTGLALDHDAYRRSLDEVDRLKKSLWSRYPHIDVILAPAAPGIAPCGQQKTGAPHMSRPWQVMGLPVITLPGLVSEQALPLGVQLIGRAHDDDALLGIANWLEPMLADV